MNSVHISKMLYLRLSLRLLYISGLLDSRFLLLTFTTATKNRLLEFLKEILSLLLKLLPLVLLGLLRIHSSLLHLLLSNKLVLLLHSSLLHHDHSLLLIHLLLLSILLHISLSSTH